MTSGGKCDLLLFGLGLRTSFLLGEETLTQKTSDSSSSCSQKQYLVSTIGPLNTVTQEEGREGRSSSRPMFTESRKVATYSRAGVMGSEMEPLHLGSALLFLEAK